MSRVTAPHMEKTEATFRDHLIRRGYPEERLGVLAEKARAFEDYLLATSSRLSVETLATYSDLLIKAGRNARDDYAGAGECALFRGCQDVYVAALEILDGPEVMDVLREQVKKLAGEARRDQVFSGVALPGLGCRRVERAACATQVMGRMRDLLPADLTRKALLGVRHGLPDGAEVDWERELYLASGGLDEFLALSHRRWLEILEGLARSGERLFTIKVDDAVVRLARENPEMVTAVRHGDRLYASRLPYQPQEYLSAADPTLKRYYFCHCPWVKEAILDPAGAKVSADFCYCSLGYMQSYWQAILGCPVEGEILESVLAGDRRCRVALNIPVGTKL